MALNKEFCLLVVVTVLEVILFQQVFVNLITDINHLKVIKEYIEHLKLVDKHHVKEIDESKFSEKTGLASYFLNFSSAFNFCLSFIYILCVYIAMNQTSKDSKRSLSRFCGDFVILSRLVNFWYIFKICLCISLFLVLRISTGMSFVDDGYFLCILLASFGKLIE